MTVTLTEEDHMVLVAEDDTASRTATRLFLQRVGYRVGEAADGPATLREASLGSYDLVVLDLGLPGLDGEEVLARLRRDSALPVIVLTGRSEESERVRVLEPGCRRLRREAVLAPRARRAHPGRAATRPAHRSRRTRSSTTAS